MIRLHHYPDSGRTGLAAFCDTCGEQITEHGFVVWNCDEAGDVIEWRVVHQQRCDDRRFQQSCSLELNVLYLAHSAGIDVDAAYGRLELLTGIGL